jgi:hypothetical protein
VLFFKCFDTLNGIWETGSFEMEIKQQKLSALVVSNVSTLVSSQNKIKSPVSQCITNINHHSYNKQLVWNRLALQTAGRLKFSSIISIEWKQRNKLGSTNNSCYWRSCWRCWCRHSIRVDFRLCF